MKPYLILNPACVLIASASLSQSYILAGYWLILPALLIMMFFWLLLKRWSVFRTSSALLSIFICLGAVGLTLDLSMPLILIACTAALAGWELTNFGQDLVKDPRVERYHLRSLGIATFTGLLLAILSSSISLQASFAVILVLALIAIGSLTYAVQSLVKKL